MSGAAAIMKGVKAKTAQDLVQKTHKALMAVDPEKQATVVEAAKFLGAMKNVLYGAASPAQETIVSQAATEAYAIGLMYELVKKIEIVGFESKKDTVAIFNKLLRRELGARMPTVEHICGKPEILTELVQGYTKKHVDALNCGMMLRECIKQEPLTKVILNDDSLFGNFFEYVQLQQFDVAADAFSTFKELLTAHKIACADFLEKNYDKVFGAEQYQQLLSSGNYVTRRQALKLLGELLLDRANFSIMTKYISNPENLKVMMNMLRDPSKNIQFEAFHVFKIFVANPNKEAPIMRILLGNKQKLIDYLTKFHESRAEDEQFADEKDYLIKQIKALK